MNNVSSVNPPGVEFLTRDNLLHLLDCVPYLLFAFFICITRIPFLIELPILVDMYILEDSYTSQSRLFAAFFYSDWGGGGSSGGPV